MHLWRTSEGISIVQDLGEKRFYKIVFFCKFQKTTMDIFKNYVQIHPVIPGSPPFAKKN